MAYLDRVIVVDNHEPRATAVSHLVSKHAATVEVLLDSDNGPSNASSKLRERINQCLADGENVMVVFCCMTGVRGGIVNILREAERIHEKGTRRFLVDCNPPSKVNRGFKQRGVSRKGIKHVVYDQDGKWQNEFSDLMEGVER